MGVFVTIILIYVILGLLVFVKILSEKTGDNGLPVISIIVAARNEEKHINACLTSLVNLDYPAEKLEIILVNDNSADATEEKMRIYTSQYPHLRTFTLPTVGRTLPGKAGAVRFGIEQSRGEYIFLTDADCQVPAAWVKEMLGSFTPVTGLVGSVTLLDKANDNSTLFTKIQSIDWLYLQSVAASANRYGSPLSWFGNNMAVRRQAYLDVGGFDNIRGSIVEDFAFLLQMKKNTRWKIRFAFSVNSLVSSVPAHSFDELYNQRKRWASGIGMVSLPGKLLMLFAFLAHAAAIAGFFFLPWFVVVSGIVLPVIIDAGILYRATGIFSRRDMFMYFLAFEAYYYFYTLLMPFVLLFDKKTTWKGRHYSIKGATARVFPDEE